MNTYICVECLLERRTHTNDPGPNDAFECRRFIIVIIKYIAVTTTRGVNEWEWCRRSSYIHAFVCQKKFQYILRIDTFIPSKCLRITDVNFGFCFSFDWTKWFSLCVSCRSTVKYWFIYLPHTIGPNFALSLFLRPLSSRIHDRQVTEPSIVKKKPETNMYLHPWEGRKYWNSCYIRNRLTCNKSIFSKRNRRHSIPCGKIAQNIVAKWSKRSCLWDLIGIRRSALQ